MPDVYKVRIIVSPPHINSLPTVIQLPPLRLYARISKRIVIKQPVSSPVALWNTLWYKLSGISFLQIPRKVTQTGPTENSHGKETKY